MALSENQLIVPALIAMLNSPTGYISTSDLIDEISSQFTLDRQDLAPLLNRNDEKYTQIVRNLKSHKTFVKLGLAEEVDGGFRILPAGTDWLVANGFVPDQP
ncbi:hypothetical protein HNP38_001176 [Chryseobacterium defluvii]|uniref:Mrr restriction endonuclease-like protein n=1 Tax=Chryseobacterium defluvii TaxID=160396 RepID=A0A840KDR4_9FLAO|nr:hypothetical protein [Chryseobacterium defluvii]MBB4805904.1 hypothetical protein [Chryseobacterium defluvii]